MNNITVCGNITRDPELRYTQTGKPVTSFGVADNRSKDKTIFFDCSAFDDMAERIVKYFKKGKPIFVSGTLDQRTYTGKDGVERTSL
ncbi:MAG: single-stranded DNA-binding protein, partial [bacterium]